MSPLHRLDRPARYHSFFPGTCLSPVYYMPPLRLKMDARHPSHSLLMGLPYNPHMLVVGALLPLGDKLLQTTSTNGRDSPPSLEFWHLTV
jgi:hypothetical protein